MAIRDTQDALFIEWQSSTTHVRDTQDALLIEWQSSTTRVRVTQDALLIEWQSSTARVRVTQDALLIEWQSSTARVRDTQDAMLYEYPFISGMFAYQAPGASVITNFTPVYPPIRKQPFTLWGMQAVRHDSIAVDGQKRTVLDHIDTVTTLHFDWVALSDMAAWKAFEQYALGGRMFGYCALPDYPGAKGDPTAFSAAKLLSMDWKPKFKCPHLFSLEMKLLLVRDM
jgi:hypothetical protein